MAKSYINYGNDGNHFNKSFKELPNSAVGDSLSLELYYSSDHLPVYADFKFEIITDVADEIEIPNLFKLSQNYPNPFNPSTTIEYTIPLNVRRETQNVTLKVYDILGRVVATLVNKEQPAGNYTVQFDASGLTSGLYFYRLHYGESINTKKMLLIK